MKIVVTGSLGHIGRPLTQELIERGNKVKVVSSSAERRHEIEELGASAAIGSLEDAAFLTETFTGADAVYIMVPPNNYFDHDLDLIGYYMRLGENYSQAIMKSGVKRVVNLSTIGAHLDKGSGILLGAHNVEGILNKLPEDVSITHMRPTSFYYNLYGYIHMIKSEGIIAANYGADKVVPWVAPGDIAEAIADELTTAAHGRKVRYVGSEELTGNEVASILGKAIGRPEIKWVLVPDEDVLNALIAAGMNPAIAAGLVEMYGSLYSGLLAEDYFRNRPAVMGRVKMTEFAAEFAAVYNEI